MLYDRRCGAFQRSRYVANGSTRMISFFMTIPLLIHGQTEATWLPRQLSFMVALAGEFNKFTKDMTESPVVLPVHLCVGEGAEHRVQTGARNA
jgi:hypothetical protein